jgi:hypothetical protein
MTLIIRRGLRRLEFQPHEQPQSGGTTHVIVDFATPTALTADQVVQINLGVREGIERTLAGRPRLLQPGSGRNNEFIYRLEGKVG